MSLAATLQRCSDQNCKPKQCLRKHYMCIQTHTYIHVLLYMQRVRRPLAWVKPAANKRHTGHSTHHIGINTPIAQAWDWMRRFLHALQ